MSDTIPQWRRPRTLVLGGMGSGKSVFAESLVADLMAEGTLSAGRGTAAVYIATAEARGDADMAARIERHRARRGAGWTTVEAPLEIAAEILRHGGRGAPILVECLSLWLANLMEAGRDPAAETADVVSALAAVPAPAVLVSNEVGLGGVPGNELARRFAEAAGAMNQTIAAACNRVVLVAAGLPLNLKNEALSSVRSRLA